MAGAQRRGSNWTADEDQRLLKLFESGKSWVFISANLRRPAKTARERLAYLQRQAKKANLDGRPIEAEFRANEPFNASTASVDGQRAKEAGRTHRCREDRRRNSDRPPSDTQLDLLAVTTP
jgi:hypothetical protein